MSLRRTPTLAAQRRALTALVLCLSAAVAAIAVLSTGWVTREDLRDDKVERSNELLLTMDELNESLRADTLQAATTAADKGARTDLDELRATLDRADLTALPPALQETVGRLLEAERRYTDEVAAGFAGRADVYAAHRRAALETLGPLTAELDAVRDELAKLGHARARATAHTGREALLLISCSILLAGAVIVFSLRRALASVGDTVKGLTATVRAVSEGDMAARTGVNRDDELGELATVLDQMADGLGEAMGQLKAGYADEEGRGRFARALEQTENEHDVYHVMSRGVAAMLPDRPARVLVADASEMHLTSVTPGADPEGCCDVASPANCPAIRGARTLVMGTSAELDACPRLRDRPGEAVSAVCTPVTFLGKGLGVVQVIGSPGEKVPERTLHSLRDAAHLAGSRLGTMRALQQAQRQATVDPLTGLLNRRTLEDRVRAMISAETPFAVAMLDLDHFKNLNDTRGHEVGDTALKTFSQVLRSNLRDEDVISRFGGEEFVVVLPNCTAEDALSALLHVRGALQQAVVASGVPFTFSGGVTDSRASDSWPVLLRIADAGLMACKQAGRDRVAVGELVPDERRAHV